MTQRNDRWKQWHLKPDTQVGSKADNELFLLLGSTFWLSSEWLGLTYGQFVNGQYLKKMVTGSHGITSCDSKIAGRFCSQRTLGDV